MSPVITYVVIPIGLLAMLALALPYLAMFIKGRWAKLASNHVRCLWWPPAGFSRFEWLKIEDGVLKLPDKPGTKRREFSLSELSTRPIPYPIGFPSFVQVVAHLVVLDTESYEPISNRAGMLTLSPIRLGGIDNSNVITKASEQMRTEEEQEKVSKNKGGVHPLIWIILGILVLGFVGLGIWYAMQSGAVDNLKQGLGIP